MIEFYTGLPRSGKSYRAVHYIKNNFMDHKNMETYAKYKYLYTNIGGFKFDLVQMELESYPIDEGDDFYTKKVYPFDFEKLYHHLKKLYAMSLKEVPDDEMIAYCEKYNLTPAVFIIDESYKYFKKKSDEVLLWWLAYHGHLGHHIILIVQNRNMLSSDYKFLTENFIDAQPISKSFVPKNFTYYHYGSDEYKKDLRYQVSRVLIDQDVFNLYKSGDKHKPKNILQSYLYLMIFGLLLSAYLFYTMIERFTGAEEQEVVNSKLYSEEQEVTFVEDDPITAKERITNIYQIRCDDGSCWLKDDTYEYYTYPLDYFKTIVMRKGITYLFSDMPVSYSRVLTVNKKKLSVNTFAMSDYYYEIEAKTVRHYFPEWFKDHKENQESFIQEARPERDQGDDRFADQEELAAL